MYIAALSAVNPQLYEATVVDGASQRQKMLFIDIPLLIGALSCLRACALPAGDRRAPLPVTTVDVWRTTHGFFGYLDD